jgi:hypothetical protein
MFKLFIFSFIAYEYEQIQFAHPKAHITHYFKFKKISYVHLLHESLYNRLCRPSQQRTD